MIGGSPILIVTDCVKHNDCYWFEYSSMMLFLLMPFATFGPASKGYDAMLV